MDGACRAREGASPRRPSQSVLYRYLQCGVLAHGFGRALRGKCGHDFLIAFSCKGRGVCPSCNGRRMVGAAAHLTDHVLPCLPVRH
jgi:hypothetical protein